MIEQRLRTRLESLKQEFAKGQQRLKELDEERVQIQNTLLRISGAVQVLEEELNVENSETSSNGQHIPVQESTNS